MRIGRFSRYWNHRLKEWDTIGMWEDTETNRVIFSDYHKISETQRFTKDYYEVLELLRSCDNMKLIVIKGKKKFET